MAASDGSDGPGRIVYLVAFILTLCWLALAGMLHGLMGLSLWFLGIGTVIIWIMAFALESNIMDRVHRNGFARNECKMKAPYDVSSRDLAHSVGIVNWQEDDKPGAH